jgi:hypothetical protein
MLWKRMETRLIHGCASSFSVAIIKAMAHAKFRGVVFCKIMIYTVSSNLRIIRSALNFHTIASQFFLFIIPRAVSKRSKTVENKIIKSAHTSLFAGIKPASYASSSPYCPDVDFSSSPSSNNSDNPYISPKKALSHEIVPPEIH